MVLKDIQGTLIPEFIFVTKLIEKLKISRVRERALKFDAGIFF